MKTISILILLLLICVGCEKKSSSSYIVWLTKENEVVYIEINHIKIAPSILELVIKKSVKEYKDFELNISLTKDVEITNAHIVLDIAEKYGVKKIKIKLDQVQPPRPPLKDPKDMSIN